MTPSRWQQIEAICQAVLALAHKDRAGYLDQACAGDLQLRRQVESLVAQDASKAASLSRPPSEPGAGYPTTSVTVTILARGMQIGPYRIEGSLGKGGMGEVFRAIDTRLGRSVAIKTSQEQFSERFEREARAISALNHPHICTLYDVGATPSGTSYLVMELVEGESLAARLKRGRLSISETLKYGQQIADALAAAHAKGIIHRDLKPQNIMLAKAGVKVLDFGLAKSQHEETLTAANMVVGTPAYMAPEQREGEACDARTDIYALGLVLREMASSAPAQLSSVIERCLATEPDNRWHSAADVKIALELATPASTPATTGRSGDRRYWAAIVVLGVIAAALAVVHFRARPPSGERTLRLAVNTPNGADLREGFAISPDGSRLAFVVPTGGVDKLWIRPLNSPAARELPGTDGAAQPFWSPDSRSVGFFASGKLKRIEAAGGQPTVICDVGQGRGGTWNSEGTILFNSVNDGPLLRVSAAGGETSPLTMLDAAKQENSHRWPYFLPGGRRFLYFVRSANSDTSGVYLGSLDQPLEKIKLMSSSATAVYAPPKDGQPGFLLWIRDGNLMAQPFNAESAQLTGKAAAVAEMVRVNPAGRNIDVSVSDEGTLVYAGAALAQYQLTWYGRDGRQLGTIGPPDSYAGVRISPDGARIAVVRAESPSRPAGAALLEITRGIPTPFAVSAFGSVWSPDSERIAYTWSPGGAPNVYTKETSSAGPQQRLTESQGSQQVYDWSADGRFLLYSEDSNDLSARTQSDLWVLPLTGDRKPLSFMRTPFREPRGQFSPDVKWIAYTSNEPGRDEVYVQSFPAGRAKWQISSQGGDYARWRKDGRELFYVAPDRTLMSVVVRPARGSLEFGSPAALFKITVPPPWGGAYVYDAAADGQRFLALAPAGEAAGSSMAVVLNWQEDVSRVGK